VELREHAHQLLGLDDVDEVRPPTQVCEEHRHLAPVAAQDRLVARGNDRLRQLGREEPQLRGDRGGDESRLADEATAGQILISQRLHAEVEDAIDVESAGRFTLKGFRRPVTAFNVVAVRDEAMTAAAPGPSFRFPIE